MFADFFKDKDVQVFPSGGESKSPQANRFRTYVASFLAMAGVATAAYGQSSDQAAPDQNPKAETELAEAFKSHSITQRGDALVSYTMRGDSLSKSRIGTMVDEMAQTKTGLSILKEIEKNDCTIAMMSGMGTNIGVFVPELNAVILNAAMPDSVLMSTLIHEGTHARQVHETGYNPNNKMTAETLFTLGRAMEADATTHQIFAAYELSEKGNSSAWNAIREMKPLMTQEFLEAKEKYPAAPDSIAKYTMLGFYKNKEYVDIYEFTYARSIAAAALDHPYEKLDELGSVSIPTDSISAKICVMDGRSYLGADGSALRDPAVYYIHDHTKELLDIAGDVFEARQTSQNILLIEAPIKADRSYEQFVLIKTEKPGEKGRIGEAPTAEADKGTPLPQKASKTIHFNDALRMMKGKSAR